MKKKQSKKKILINKKKDLSNKTAFSKIEKESKKVCKKIR